jgi:hypothetical protein
MAATQLAPVDDNRLKRRPIGSNWLGSLSRQLPFAHSLFWQRGGIFWTRDALWAASLRPHGISKSTPNHRPLAVLITMSGTGRLSNFRNWRL